MANIEEDQVVPEMEEEQDPYPADDYCYEAELVRDFPILHEVSTKLHTFDCFLPPTTWWSGKNGLGRRKGRRWPNLVTKLEDSASCSLQRSIVTKKTKRASYLSPEVSLLFIRVFISVVLNSIPE